MRRNTGGVAAAAKVMRLAGDQVHCGAAASVEVRVVGLPCRVDGHQHTLAIHAALKDQLAGLHQNIVVAAPAQGSAFGAGLGPAKSERSTRSIRFPAAFQ